mgnify:CR=1 FL=1
MVRIVLFSNNIIIIMRIEIIILAITIFIMANIYTDGKYTKLLLSWKKYYQMSGVAFVTFMLYVLIKKNPLHAREIVNASNDYIKYLPIDKIADYPKYHFLTFQ